MNESAPKRTNIAVKALPVAGEVERLLVTESGFFLGLGWVGDDGLGPARWSLGAERGGAPIAAAALRGSRAAPVADGPGADAGFRILGKAGAGRLIGPDLTLRAQFGSAAFEAAKTPEAVSEKRLLDVFLEEIAAEAGGEAELHDFLAGPGGADLMALVARHVESSLANPYVESFGRRSVSRAFVTALGDSADAIAAQPLLFRRRRIEFGQWVYVCASREVGVRALETARWVADLYDAMITVIVLGQDGGEGAARDIGVALAEAESIGLVGRDVYPSPAHAELTRTALASRVIGGDLWGALLLADDHTLASAGLRFEREPHLRRRPSASGAGPVAWTRAAPIGARGRFPAAPTAVAAISGAFMAFAKSAFERVGGFSTRYVYEGSEDSDLSLRWRQAGGRVLVDPDLRFLQLDGYKYPASARRGAEIVNRGLFTLRQPQLGLGSAA